MGRWKKIILFAAAVASVAFINSVANAPAEYRLAQAYKTMKRQKKLPAAREIKVLAKTGQVISSAHYERLANELRAAEKAGYAASEISRLRELLGRVNPQRVINEDAARAAEIAAQNQRGKKGPCSTERPVIMKDFTDPENIQEITPPGSSTRDRDVAKGHSWVWTGGARVPFYAPVDGVLESFGSLIQNGATHYVLTFRVKGSCGYAFRFAHITEPDPTLTEGVAVFAGTLLGYTIGNIPSGNWDFGWYNLDEPGPLAAIHAYGMHSHGLCFVDYYMPEKQSFYRNLLKGPQLVCQF